MQVRPVRNALLVYPEFPPSYWGYGYALDFIGKKSTMPPLGLLTVAGMFPTEWSLRLVDMNVEPLTDVHLSWADVAFTSTMIVQQASFLEVVERCNRAGVPVVAGGPHPTALHEEIAAQFPEGRGVSHFVLGEAEEVFPDLLRDLRSGDARAVYRSAKRPDIANTPLPRFDLVDFRVYGSMALQFSRGCPFDCEFCDITALYGRVPRTKSNRQVLAELDLLYRMGWRGSLFFVDDNFIGNRRDAMRLLPAMAGWQSQHGHPFAVYTEASVNLAEMPELMDAMRDAGFHMAFLGIESPNGVALRRTGKGHNTRGEETTYQYLLRAVRRIQSRGMEVTGGFIIGLDGDTEFDSHLEFIREAGVALAMTGMLTALKGTRLYRRLEQEGRLREPSIGCNTEISLNFEPELPREHLIAEYRRVISTLYDPTLRNYFERCLVMFEHLGPREHDGRTVSWRDVAAFVRSLRVQLLSRQGPAYARFLAKVVTRHRRHFSEAVRLAIKGYHFEKVTRQQIAVDDFKAFLEAELEAFRRGVPGDTAAAAGEGARVGVVEPPSAAQLARVAARLDRRRRRISRDFRPAVDRAIRDFYAALHGRAPRDVDGQRRGRRSDVRERCR